MSTPPGILTTGISVLPRLQKLVQIHVNTQTLGRHSFVDRPQFLRLHVRGKRHKRLHHHLFRPWAVPEGSVENILGPGSKLLVDVAKTDVGYPNLHTRLARVARDSVFVRGPSGVNVAPVHLMLDRKQPASHAVMLRHQHVVVQDDACLVDHS